MDKRPLIHLVRLVVETFFRGEGVPPSHVWASKGIIGIMQGV